MTRDLRPLLAPRAVAVIGASRNPTRAGSVLLGNIQAGGYEGAIYPINPTADEINGLRCYSAVTAVDDDVELAFITVRRELVGKAIDDCIRAGVKAAVIITAGFGEADDWGRAEQARLAEVIERSGLLVTGPNAIGMVARGARLQGSFVHFPHWEDGPIAIVAQSGIFAGAVAHEAMSRDVGRLGIRTTVAVGNRVGVTEADLLEALGDDDDVGVIGFYLESFADARPFLRAAAEVKTRKPVVVLKPGRTAPGARAAASHTGSLTGDDAVLDQLLRQHGVVRAADDEEFVAILDSFAKGPVPLGPRLGLVTFSGAMGVIATDLADESGLELPAYTDETVARFSALLPDWQGVGNPADLWPAVDLDPAEALCGGLGAALGDPATDQVLGILLAVPNADFEGMRERFAALRRAVPDKPLHLVISGGLREKWTRELDGLGIPIHPSLRVAVRSLSAVTWYGRVRDDIPTAAAHELASAIGGTR